MAQVVLTPPNKEKGQRSGKRGNFIPNKLWLRLEQFPWPVRNATFTTHWHEIQHTTWLGKSTLDCQVIQTAQNLLHVSTAKLKPSTDGQLQQTRLLRSQNEKTILRNEISCLHRNAARLWHTQNDKFVQVEEEEWLRVQLVCPRFRKHDTNCAGQNAQLNKKISPPLADKTCKLKCYRLKKDCWHKTHGSDWRGANSCLHKCNWCTLTVDNFVGFWPNENKPRPKGVGRNLLWRLILCLAWIKTKLEKGTVAIAEIQLHLNTCPTNGRSAYSKGKFKSTATLCTVIALIFHCSNAYQRSIPFPHLKYSSQTL